MEPSLLEWEIHGDLNITLVHIMIMTADGLLLWKLRLVKHMVPIVGEMMALSTCQWVTLNKLSQPTLCYCIRMKEKVTKSGKLNNSLNLLLDNNIGTNLHLQLIRTWLSPLITKIQDKLLLAALDQECITTFTLSQIEMELFKDQLLWVDKLDMVCKNFR